MMSARWWGIIIVLLILTCLMIVSPTSAATFVVTPTDLQGWAAANVRANATVGLTTTQSRSGSGSLEFTTNTVTPGQDKADFQITWSPVTFPTRTLSNLSALNYEFFRNSTSSTAAHFHPVIRILWYFDNATPANQADDRFGTLIWEGIYQTSALNPVPTNTWLFQNVLNQRFWMFISGGGVVQNYTSTLANWLAGTPVGQPGDPIPPNFALPNSTTYVYGINLGVGSGWGATFQGFVDNVTFGFGGISNTYNFEPFAPAPTPTANTASNVVPATKTEPFICNNLEQASSGDMTAVGVIGNVRQGDVFGNVYCRIITRDSLFVTSPAEIGNLPLLQMGGIINAVDLFGLLPDGVSIVPFIKPVRVCLRGSGTIYFLNAADATRTVHQLPIIAVGGGMTCADVPVSGTVILMSQQSVTSSPAETNLLTGCEVKTTHIVRLRAEPNTTSTIMARVPFDLILTATERMQGWFKVIYGDTQGWINVDYLTTHGTCGT